MPESDVCERQILKSKDGPRTENVKLAASVITVKIVTKATDLAQKILTAWVSI